MRLTRPFSASLVLLYLRAGATTVPDLGEKSRRSRPTLRGGVGGEGIAGEVLAPHSRG